MFRRSQKAIALVAFLTPITACTSTNAVSREQEFKSSARTRAAGYFAKTESHGKDIIVIVESSIKSEPPMRCKLRKSAEEQARELEPGTPVTVEGVVESGDDANHSVVFEDCSIR